MACTDNRNPETVLKMVVERHGKIHFNSGWMFSFHRFISSLLAAAGGLRQSGLGGILGPCEESWAVLIGSVH